MGEAGKPLLVAVGRVALEYTGVVDRFSDREGTTQLDEISVQVGGHAAIAAGAAAALGMNTRLLCKLADDFQKNFILEALQAAGVEVQGVLDGQSRLSPVSFHVRSQTTERRFGFATPGDVPALEADEFKVDDILANASALLCDGSELEAQRILARAARKRAIPVILHGSERSPGMEELIPFADVLIASERMAIEFAPQEDELRPTLLALSKLGPKAVVVTLGKKGAVGLHMSQWVERESFRTEVKDRSGASGVFQGAFATALLSDLPFVKCIEFASAAAALSCQKLGSFAGIPTREEVLDFVRRKA
jgi:sugar/nucleoside kinase (ribokinase family)